jgi:hypothetical protein
MLTAPVWYGWARLLDAPKKHSLKFAVWEFMSQDGDWGRAMPGGG